VTVSNTAIRDIGVPVRGVNWTRLLVGRDANGAECLLATMGQQGDDFFVLEINPATGRCRQFIATGPMSNYPTAAYLSRAGRLYVGSCWSGCLHCYDPVNGTLENLGEIDGKAAIFPCQIDEDSQGRIWIGAHPGANLTCYDPRGGEFTRYGPMDDVDHYCYSHIIDDETIVCMICMTCRHVVLFDPKTGRKQTVGPTVPAEEGNLSLEKRSDGNFYIISTAGNYRIEGWSAVEVKELPAPAPPQTLSDGSTFDFADPVFFRVIEIRRSGGARRLELDFKYGGTDIFYLHLGPDGCVYGSSVMPLHLFRYNPANGEMVDLGLCSKVSGEAYSMANLDGKLYISAYPYGEISVYDPTRPYHLGEGPDDNPRDLGRIDEISYRPRSTLAGPLGRIWTASYPAYGLIGGPLSCYDPASGGKQMFRQFGNRCAFTLAHLPRQELIAVGTTIYPGSGAAPKEKQAVLVLWDYHACKAVWEGTPDRPVDQFNALIAGPDGRLYGTVTGPKAPAEFLAFDPVSRAFEGSVRLPSGSPLDVSLQIGPDGKIYGFTRSCIYRVETSTMAMEVLLETNDEFHYGGPIVGKDIYFATGVRLRAARIL
jgi:hypothetical protein